MFSMIYSQLCYSHVQYDLQSIVVVLICSVWFTANCCGADLFSMIYSQLLCCSYIQYGLQPIIMVLIWSVWCTAKCCASQMFSTFLAHCYGAHVFSIVYNQLLWCWHVQYDLQSIVVLLIYSVWFTANCCGADKFNTVYSQMLCCSNVQYFYSPLLWCSRVQCSLQSIAVVLTCPVWFTANCCCADMFSMVSLLLCCWDVQNDLQPIVVVLTCCVWF